MTRIQLGSGVAAALFAACISDAGARVGEAKVAESQHAEALGKLLFFDQSLSTPSGQGCQDCHAREVGFTGPVEELNRHGAVYHGAIIERFGNRKPPSSAYATRSPRLAYDMKSKVFAGGNFWDGRATGWELGSPAADQAMGPPLNPVEQNNPDERAVCQKIASAGYARLFELVWGKGSLDCSKAGAHATYQNFARAIAIYEASRDMSAYTSKYDAYLRVCEVLGNDRKACAEGQGKKSTLDPMSFLSDVEWEGLVLFVGDNDNDGTLRANEGAGCASCHSMEWMAGEGASALPVFTDFTYDNIGVPRNPDNPWYRMDKVFYEEGGEQRAINPAGKAWVDPGLGGFLKDLADDKPSGWRGLPFVPKEMKALSREEILSLARANYGKHRVPTLRNVDKRPHDSFVKAFFHNGSFKSLKDVVHFYNTRDVLPRCKASGRSGVDCWPAPEVEANLNRKELGNLGLSEHQEEALVSFMATLNDR